MILPETIQRILDDKTSGSVTLLKRLMLALEQELLDPELSPELFIGIIQQLRNRMEMFTVIRHFCDELMLSHNFGVQKYPDNYLEFIQEYKMFWEQAPSSLMTHLMETIPLKGRTLMLHSNSGTIREVFKKIATKEKDIRIYQTLSAPMEEGRIQAHDLAGMGFKVTLIADTLAAMKLQSCHYLILGADQIRKDTIVNKTGSLQMVLAAQQFNIPVYVLTESRKTNSSSSSDFTERERDPSEILGELRHPNLRAENSYFEEVPKYLITKIITERRPD